jgi:hypothetical protein
MAEGAHVKSLESIEAFRAALLVYLGKSRPLLEDACDEVIRTREWLRNDRRIYWEQQVRKRRQTLEQAKQALFSAELSKLRAPTTAEQALVHHARRTLGEAEDKVRRIKKWMVELENHVAPVLKQLENLRTILAADIPKAAAYLAQVVVALESYANVARPVSSLSNLSADVLNEESSLLAGDQSRAKE